jgi:hypothetical protein
MTGIGDDHALAINHLSNQEALAAWISMLQVVKYCGVAVIKEPRRRSHASAGGGEVFLVWNASGWRLRRYFTKWRKSRRIAFQAAHIT